MFSSLARGTVTENGIIVGEGLETIKDRLSASYPGIELEKPKTAPLPSTYVTRRGPMILYSRPDIPPTWEQDVLNCYNNMGSLVDGLESVSTRKEEKMKNMDPRCVPGRHFNGYVGVLKNSLLCSDTMRTVTNLMDMGGSSTGHRSFPKKGHSPGLELLPIHLENMGVSLSEFLHGKGCHDLRVPTEDISKTLRSLQSAFDKKEAQETKISEVKPQETEHSQPTPAPPQSPMTEDTNQNQRVSRLAHSAGRRRLASTRRGGSAQSLAFSEADSAYGTKFDRKDKCHLETEAGNMKFRPFHTMLLTSKLPPISQSLCQSADMSTHRSAASSANRLDAVLDRRTMQTEDVKVSIAKNNSGDRTGYVERQLLWVPDTSDPMTQTLSVREDNDVQETQEPRNHMVDNNKIMTRTRVAEWVNAADSGIPPPSTPMSLRYDAEEENEKDGPEFYLINPSTGSFPDFEAKPEKMSKSKKPKRQTSGEDTSSLDHVTVSSTFESFTLERPTSQMKSIDEGIDEKDSSRISVTDDNETKAFSMSDLENGAGNFEVDAQATIVDLTSKTSVSFPVSHHASVDLPVSSNEKNVKTPLTTFTSSQHSTTTTNLKNRNASNAFGVDWNTDKETPLVREIMSEDNDTLSKRENHESKIFALDCASETQLKSSRPHSSLSGSSGVDTLVPSTMASIIDNLSIAPSAKPELASASILDPAVPISDAVASEAPAMMPSVHPDREASIAISLEDIRSSPSKGSKKPVRPKATAKAPRRTQRARRTVRASSAANAASRAKSADAASAAAKEREDRAERERVRILEKKAAMEETARVEKERRLAQAAMLQDRIKSAEEQRQEQQRITEKRKQETEQRLKALAAEEESMRQMEEEARHQMMASRKEMREARERRRQEELERRKEEIQRRREDDERRQEQATRREREMLARLGDPALQQRMEKDEAARREERDRLMMERIAEEERYAEERANAEEARMAEFERLAEEEAVARIREDMDEVEERRRTLLREQEELRREEEELNLAHESDPAMKRSYRRQIAQRRAAARMEIARPNPRSATLQRALALFSYFVQYGQGDNNPLQDCHSEKRRSSVRHLRHLRSRMAALAERRKQEEEREQEAERQRQREEEEMEMRMKLELEEADLRRHLMEEATEREAEMMRRREHNMEVRSHLQSLQLNQDLTRPWVFSYLVHWPRESFEKPIGGGASKQKRFRFPPKSASKSKGSLPPL